jgi:hypothetical protein
MSAKMNWDRVRKESQARRSGSAWIGSDAVGPTAGEETKSSRRRESSGSQSSLRPKISGCICGKVIGFTGSHKKKCPLSNSSYLRTPSNSSLKPSSEWIKKAKKVTPAEQFIASLQTAVALARGIPVKDRQRALKLIRTLLDSLEDTAVQEPNPDDSNCT